jgi:hypothetical protein
MRERDRVFERIRLVMGKRRDRKKKKKEREEVDSNNNGAGVDEVWGNEGILEWTTPYEVREWNEVDATAISTRKPWELLVPVTQCPQEE